MSSPPHQLGSRRVDDLLAIPEEQRFHEIIDGELVPKPIPSFEHGGAQVKLAAALDPFHRRQGATGLGGWWLASETEIALAPAEVVRPDLAGWRRDVVSDRPSGVPVRVRPQWICEILSPSNARTDTVKKLRVYHAHGIENYWLLDPDARTLVVQRWSAEGYLTVLAAEAGDRVRAEPFDGVEIVLSEVLGID